MKPFRTQSEESAKEKPRNDLRKYLTIGKTLRLYSLLAFTVVAVSFNRAESKGATEWRLVQMKSSDEISVYLTHDAVKLVSATSDYRIVMKAPNWRVFVFQPDQKKIWEGALDEFNNIAIYKPMSRKLAVKIVPLKEISRENRDGLRVVNYKALESSAGDLMASDDIHVSAQVAELLSRYFGTPCTDKVPLRWQFTAFRNGAATRSESLRKTSARWLDYDQFSDRRTGTQLDLATKSCKRISFNASDFDVPSGYEKVARIRDVCISNKQRDSIKSILDELGRDAEIKN